MKLNTEQSAAVEMALRASKKRGSVVVLAGPAGTGKTTTLKAVGAALGDAQWIMCPTGRAAKRAAEATGMPAQTIHRWLYAPSEEDDDTVHFTRRQVEDLDCPPSHLLIIDEASMVGRDVWDDVESVARQLRLSILLVGDGFQLPPVAPPDEAPFSVFADDFRFDERVTLTEVWRQALESPVLRAATALRQSSIDEARRIISRELPRLQTPLAEFGAQLQREKADAVVIAHRNETRLGLNREIRARLGIDREADPQAGEPVLVRRNSAETGVMNGEIVSFHGWLEPPTLFRRWRCGRTIINGIRCAQNPDAMLGRESEPRFWDIQAMSLSRSVPYVRAQLGYALTCHSAQGSEWDRVVVVVEPSLQVMPEQERIRWLYTAITRAKSEVLIATPPVSAGRQRARSAA